MNFYAINIEQKFAKDYVQRLLTTSGKKMDKMAQLKLTVDNMQ